MQLVKKIIQVTEPEGLYEIELQEIHRRKIIRDSEIIDALLSPLFKNNDWLLVQKFDLTNFLINSFKYLKTNNID